MLRALLWFFSWAMFCDATSGYVILLLHQIDKTVFHHPSQGCEDSHCLQQHTIPATVRKHYFDDICAPPSASKETSRHKCSTMLNNSPSPGPHSNLFHSCYHFCDCHKSILSDECNDFFLFLLVQAVCRQTLKDCQAMSLFQSLKCFTIMTLLAPMQASSKCTLTSCMNIWYWDFLLNKKTLLLCTAKTTHSCHILCLVTMPGNCL